MTDTAPSFVDARCKHPTCAGKDSYRMVGGCYNCGASPILALITAGHEKPISKDCPVCGCPRMHFDRLATPDEIPAAFEENPS